MDNFYQKIGGVDRLISKNVTVLVEEFPDKEYRLRVIHKRNCAFIRRGTEKAGLLVKPKGGKKYHAGINGDWDWLGKAKELFTDHKSRYMSLVDDKEVYINGIVSFTDISRAMHVKYGDMPQTSSQRLRRCWRRGWIRRFKGSKVFYKFEEMTDDEFGLPRIHGKELQRDR